MRGRIILFAWAHIAGIILGMFTLSEITASSNAWFFYLAGAAALIAAGLYLSGRRGILFSVYLVFFALFLGIGNFNRVTDSSSPAHVSREMFFDEDYNSRTRILGTVDAEPDVKEDRTLLYVRPFLIQPEPPRGKYYEISGGRVLVSLYPSAGEKYGSFSYGDGVELMATMLEPYPPRNPGVFDYGKYLRTRHNVYGTVSVKKDYEIFRRSGEKKGPLDKLSLGIKNRMIRVIKQTMPYPDSAFIGGMLLGLKGGIGGCSIKVPVIAGTVPPPLLKVKAALYELFGSKWEADKLCNMPVQEELMVAGAWHLTALSGLHVSIISAILVGLFTLIRFPKKLYMPFAVICLAVFILITGLRPSSIWAGVMSCFVLLSWAYMALDLRSALLFGISLAALAILIFNPLALVDPAFSLPFGAALALSIVTGPLDRFLRKKLKGFSFVALLISLAAFTVLALKYREAFLSNILLMAGFILASGGLWALTSILDRRFPLIGVGYRMLPRWLSSFISAQIALQLGLLLPLYLTYFNKFPVAGLYVSFLALPLTGIIITVSLLAGFAGMIPLGIMLNAALVLNAFSWFSVEVFLRTAHFAGKYFPHPEYPGWNTRSLFIYFAVLIFLSWSTLFVSKIRAFVYGLLQVWETRPLRPKMIAVAACLALLVLYSGYLTAGINAGKPALFEVRFLDAGGGSCILVSTPEGKKILIDGGPIDRRRDLDVWKNFFLPAAFDNSGARDLEAVVSTSYMPEHMDGLIELLARKDVGIKKIYGVFEPSVNASLGNFTSFVEYLNDDYIRENQNAPWVRYIYDNTVSFFKRLADKKIPYAAPAKGDILYSGGGVKLTALTPYMVEASEDFNANAFMKVIVLKLEYKGVSFLLTSNANYAVQNFLIEKYGDRLKSDVLLVPMHAKKFGFSENFLDAVSPRSAVLQYKKVAKSKSGGEEEVIEFYNAKKLKLYRTDVSGAVIMSSADGKTLDIRTMTGK